MYGIIEYNSEGKPKCEICQKHFDRVVSHVRQVHGLNATEYKIEFGFDRKKGICSKTSAEKTRVKTIENYDKVISENLVIGGAKTRFKKGHKGRTIDKVSQQTMNRLINNSFKK